MPRRGSRYCIWLSLVTLGPSPRPREASISLPHLGWRPTLRRLMLFGAALAMTVGCGSPTSPSGPPPPNASTPPAPAPGSATVTVTVTDGWTRSPVIGATVSGANVNSVTDSAGTVTVTTSTGSCLVLTVVAPGFLDRRTCVAASITLWPVADAAERAATRAAVFTGDRLHSQLGWSEGVGFSQEIRGRQDVLEIWRHAAAEISSLTGGRTSIAIADNPPTDDGFIVSAAAIPPSCTHPWFTWSFGAARFCWDRTFQYFVTNVTVDRDRLTDPVVALRALLYGFVLHQHDFPGVMNRAQPADGLSSFERKTLHMASLRRLAVDWPDFDRSP